MDGWIGVSTIPWSLVLLDRGFFFGWCGGGFDYLLMTTYGRFGRKKSIFFGFFLIP